MSDWEQDAFDAKLREAMAARPELPVTKNLASRAIARGSVPTLDAARLFSAVAAFLLICGLFATAAWKFYVYLASSESSETASTVDVNDILSSRNATMLLVGGAVFVLALGFVMLEKLFSRDDAMMPAYF